MRSELFAKRNIPIVELLIGISGSGKTTYANNMASFSISSDSIRDELYDERGDDTYKSKDNKYVFAEFDKRYYLALLKGLPHIILDATNLNLNRRIDYYKIAHNSGYKVVAHIFDIDVQTAKKRIAERVSGGGLYVPIEQVERMYDILELPRLGIDCDEILNDPQK